MVRGRRRGREPMNRFAATTIKNLAISTVLAAVVTCEVPAFAQAPGLGTVEGFDANEYYPAPDHTRLKWRITGAKAQPQDGSRYVLSGMQIQMFGKTGERQLLADAPECLYDVVKQTAQSAGPLKVQVDGDRFAIAGQGFLAQIEQTNSILTISNQVRAVVQLGLTNATGITTSTPMVITSRRFQFDTAIRQGVFSGQVRAENPDIELNCGELTANASADGSTFDSLTAENKVAVVGKTEAFTANAEHALYTHTNETMTLTGMVAWKKDAQEGRAERATIHQHDKGFEADGAVAIKMPRESLGVGGLLRGDTNAATPATDLSAPVDLFADHVQNSSNLTVIAGSVRIQAGTNQLSCDRIVIQSNSTNAIEQTAIAEGHVAVCNGDPDQCLRSDRAVYTKATGVAVFTGTPTWKLSPSEGRADRVTVNTAGEIHAVGAMAARIILAAQSNSFLHLFPGAADTNQAAQAIEVFAHELKASEQQVSLRGNARVHQAPITSHEPHLRCETLNLFFATNSHRIALMQAQDQVRFEQGIVGATNGPDVYRRLSAARLTAIWNSSTGELSNFTAEQDVVMDATDAKGQPSHATADRLVYTYSMVDGVTNKTIELTGHPQLTNTMGRFTGDPLVWNMGKGTFHARKYKGDFNVSTNLITTGRNLPDNAKK